MKQFKCVIIMILSMIVLSACSNIDKKASQDNNDSKDELWAHIEESGEIVAGTSGKLIASSYYSGDEEDEDQLTGYEVETIREVAKRLGFEVKFEMMALDSVMPAIKSGRIDISSGTITDKRKEEFDFSDPYQYSYVTMAVRMEDNSGIESLEDLEGKKAGGSATTIYSQIAEQYGAEVVTYGHAPNEAYLRDVDNGRTDVVVNDYYLTKFGVEAFPDFNIHLHPTLNFHTTETGLLLPKGADTLREKVNGVLEEMREDGTLSELAKRFYIEDASVLPDKEIIEVDGLDI